MKMRSLISTLLLVSGLLAGLNPAWADRQRTFGFTGEINSFDRDSSTAVVDDRVFRISDKVRVYKGKGLSATLSDIRPGVKVGFYPKPTGDSGQNAYIDAIWILPANWKNNRRHSDGPVRLQ
ncbi:MAG: hypothetical protein ACE5FQ_01690 [Thiogranum sp.]